MKLFTKLSLLIFFLFAIHIFTVEVLACSCTEHGTPSCAKLARSEAVFVGKVEKIHFVTEQENGGTNYTEKNSVKYTDSTSFRIRFSIEKNYKGIKDKFVDVFSYLGTSCEGGVIIKKGEQWTVYAWYDEEDKKWKTSFGMCSPTFRGNGDEFLDNYSKGFSKESVQGRVAYDLIDEFGIKNIPVRVEGENFAAAAVTGEGGSFNFEVPKPGEYKVQVKMPYAATSRYLKNYSNSIKEIPTESETIIEYKVTVPAKLCSFSQVDAEKIDLKATGEISGEFIARDWKSFPKFYPSLCKLKETESDTLTNCKAFYSLEMDGAFKFDGLREGKYVLVINEDDFPSSTAPFLRHYYPGVKNFSDAQTINLEQGQKISELKFNLPPPLTLREIKGQTFWENGTPVTFLPDSDNKLRISLYEFPNPSFRDIGDSFLKKWGKDQQEESQKLTNVKPDGTFSITAFDGFTYWVKAYIYLPNDKEKCGFAKVRFDENAQQPLKLILDRTDKCHAPEYVKELEAKSKTKK